MVWVGVTIGLVTMHCALVCAGGGTRGVTRGNPGITRVEPSVEPGVVLSLAPVLSSVFVRFSPRAVRHSDARMFGGGWGGTNGSVTKVRTKIW